MTNMTNKNTTIKAETLRRLEGQGIKTLREVCEVVKTIKAERGIASGTRPMNVVNGILSHVVDARIAGFDTPCGYDSPESTWEIKKGFKLVESVIERYVMKINESHVTDVPYSRKMTKQQRSAFLDGVKRGIETYFGAYGNDTLVVMSNPEYNPPPRPSNVITIDEDATSKFATIKDVLWWLRRSERHALFRNMNALVGQADVAGAPKSHFVMYFPESLATAAIKNGVKKISYADYETLRDKLVKQKVYI